MFPRSFFGQENINNDAIPNLVRIYHILANDIPSENSQEDGSIPEHYEPSIYDTLVFDNPEQQNEGVDNQNFSKDNKENLKFEVLKKLQCVPKFYSNTKYYHQYQSLLDKYQLENKYKLMKKPQKYISQSNNNNDAKDYESSDINIE